MTPEEKSVIDAAMEWHYAILANPSAIPLVPMSGPALALEGISHATWQLVTSCPECSAGGHTCPGDGNRISHTATDCGEHDLLEYPLRKLFADNRHASEKDFNGLIRTGEPTRREVSDITSLPPEPTGPPEMKFGVEPNIEVIKTGPNTETHVLSHPEASDITSFPPEPPSWADVPTDPDPFPEPTWEPATLLYCLAGDRIRIGQDETDVLRSSSGAWHAQIVSSVLPSGKTWDKVTPWEHMELRLDLSANPGFQEYPPNLPCEILCTPERLAILHLMQGIPGTTVIKR